MCDRELLPVYAAVKHFRHTVEGRSRNTGSRLITEVKHRGARTGQG